MSREGLPVLIARLAPLQGTGGCPAVHALRKVSPRELLSVGPQARSVAAPGPRGRLSRRRLWMSRESREGVGALGCDGWRAGRAEAANRCCARSFKGSHGSTCVSRPSCSAWPAQEVLGSGGSPAAELDFDGCTPLAVERLPEYRALPAGLQRRSAPPAPPTRAGAGSWVDPGRVLRRTARVQVLHLALFAVVRCGRPWSWTNCGPRSLAPPGLPWSAAWWWRPWLCAGPVAGRRAERSPGHTRSSTRP